MTSCVSLGPSRTCAYTTSPRAVNEDEGRTASHMTHDLSLTRPNRTPLALLGGLLCGMLIFGFIAAPHSCAWGLNAWFITGVLVGLTCVIVPFLVPGARLVRSRLGSALLLGVICFAVWLLGLFIAGFQLLCRLF